MRHRFTYTPREIPHKMRNQLRNIFTSLAQWGELDGKHVQTVIQIASKFLSRNHLGQVSMCCRHYSDIDSMRPAAAETFELLLLQNAQQFRLQRERQVPDLIKEESSVIRHFEAAGFLRDSSGKCTFLVSKQFALQKIKWNRGAIYLYEWTSAAGA